METPDPLIKSLCFAISAGIVSALLGPSSAGIFDGAQMRVPTQANRPRREGASENGPLRHTLGGTSNLPHAETHALAYNSVVAEDATIRIARALSVDVVPVLEGRLQAYANAQV